MSGRACFIAAADGLHFGVWERDRLTVSGVEAAPPLNYLAADRERGRIYAAARHEVCAFALEKEAPRLLYRAPCGGDVACHLYLSPDRDFLFCANYISGNVAVFRIRDGRFEPVQSVVGRGVCGPRRERQDGPHAHCCAFVDGNLWSVDLGQDAIFIFPWDGEKLGTEPDKLQFPAGTGPRHIVHDDVRKRVYCASELTNELFALDSDTQKIVAATSVAPPGNALSAIRLSPDGRTVGVGIRGGDAIALFDAESMTPRERIDGGGRCVRDFDFADDSTVCACFQDSSEVIWFRRTRSWRPLQRLAVPTPMCVLFGAGPRLSRSIQ